MAVVGGRQAEKYKRQRDKRNVKRTMEVQLACRSYVVLVAGSRPSSYFSYEDVLFLSMFHHSHMLVSKILSCPIKVMAKSTKTGLVPTSWSPLNNGGGHFRSGATVVRVAAELAAHM